MTQGDIRELQLAKSAIAAGLRVLLDQFGKVLRGSPEATSGWGFRQLCQSESARRIGLLELGSGKVHSAGNTALRGAKMMLLSKRLFSTKMEQVRAKTSHLGLASDVKFHAAFVEGMHFPELPLN
ncbi:MAG: ASKHA domain-containing protein [Terriglobia bacterium]